MGRRVSAACELGAAASRTPPVTGSVGSSIRSAACWPGRRAGRIPVRAHPREPDPHLVTGCSTLPALADPLENNVSDFAPGG